MSDPAFEGFGFGFSRTENKRVKASFVYKREFGFAACSTIIWNDSGKSLVFLQSAKSLGSILDLQCFTHIRSGKPRFAINQRYADCAKLFILKYFNFVLHLIFPFWQQCCMYFRFVLIREQGNKGIPQKRRTDISNKGDGICMTGIPGRFHRSRYRSGYTAFLSSMPQTPMSILSGTFCLPPFLW